MLNADSYTLALSIYLGAGLLAALCIAYWFGRRGWGGTAALFSLLTIAMLLTPAYPRQGVDTMAPALVVAAFQYFTEGQAAAMHAVRPLVLMCGIAVVLALLLKLLLFRQRRGG